MSCYLMPFLLHNRPLEMSSPLSSFTAAACPDAGIKFDRLATHLLLLPMLVHYR